MQILDYVGLRELFYNDEEPSDKNLPKTSDQDARMRTEGNSEEWPTTSGLHRRISMKIW